MQERILTGSSITLYSPFKADSTGKGYLQDDKSGKLFFEKPGKIRTSNGTNACRIIFTGLD